MHKKKIDEKCKKLDILEFEFLKIVKTTQKKIP